MARVGFSFRYGSFFFLLCSLVAYCRFFCEIPDVSIFGDGQGVWFAFGIVAMTKKQEACTTLIFMLQLVLS